MKKALITGITGFVGRHLKTLLTQKGYDVFGVSSHTLKTSTNILYADLTDFQALKKAIRQINPDEIYHLGALSSPRESFEAPLRFQQVNYLGTLNLLESVKELGLNARILYISSSEVYGSPSLENLPIVEELPINPESPYAVSKAASEILARQYVRTDKLDIKIARPFNHYGTGQDEKFVLPSFSKQIADIIKIGSEPVIMTGNLAAKRDFTNVRDVVKAYYEIQQKGESGETFNICSGSSDSIENFLKTLTSFSDRKIEVKTDPTRFRKVDIEDYYGSHEKLTQKTGWKPEITMKEGLNELFNYYLKN